MFSVGGLQAQMKSRKSSSGDEDVRLLLFMSVGDVCTLMWFHSVLFGELRVPDYHHLIPNTTRVLTQLLFSADSAVCFQKVQVPLDTSTNHTRRNDSAL